MLADMSNGSLARVGAISQKAEGEGVGNQMVGNPNYGNWQTNSSGISFWQWYGMYRILEVNRVQKQLELLSGLSANEKSNSLSQFINQFHNRFEGQFVPLDVILDDETGIGISNETSYETPLLAGLHLARAGSILNSTASISLINGQPVTKILVEEASNIANELYLGAVVDRASRKIV